MSKQPIYLDYNATSPLLPQVREAMEEVASLPLNASSVHHYGRLAKKFLENARRQVAESLSVWPDEVVFTSSATEANNLALQLPAGYRLAVAASEHSSVLNVAKQKSDAIILPVNDQGVLEMPSLATALQEADGKLVVSVMLANNETGVIQPVASIAKKVREAGGLMHCDAVQAYGKMPLDFNLLGVDMLTIAAHKIGGPVGVGILVVRNGLLIPPLLLGGGQEKRRRAGTENIPSIVGIGQLAKILPDLSHLRQWTNIIEKEMVTVSRGTTIMGSKVERLCNTICAVTPAISSETQLISFDLDGICVSAGSACSSGRIEPSHVLQAMGLSPKDANGALRISLGWATTETEVMRFIESWKNIVSKLAKKEAA